MSAPPNRQRAIATGSIGYMMQDLLQQLDRDYYRSVLLLVARAELERLQHEQRHAHAADASCRIIGSSVARKLAQSKCNDRDQRV